jgi:DNA-directed RNA polymerase subunit F
MSDESDTLIDKVFPLAIAIAHIKAELAKQIFKQIIKEVEKTRKISSSEKDAINRAVDEIVSQQPPEVFGIDLDWVPKSEEEVKEKLVKLRYDQNFKDKLIKGVLDKLKAKQFRINSTY